MWCQHLPAGETEDAALDRPQDRVDVAVPAVFLINRLWATGGDGQQRSLALEHAVLVKAFAAVGPAHCENAVRPALENAWQAEPPQRELPDHQVTGFHLTNLGLHIGRKTTDFRGVHFLDRKSVGYATRVGVGG